MKSGKGEKEREKLLGCLNPRGPSLKAYQITVILGPQILCADVHGMNVFVWLTHERMCERVAPPHIPYCWPLLR